MKLFIKPLVIALTTVITLPAWAACNDGSTMPIDHPNSQYADHGDGTVTDLKTGLMWMKCSIGQDLEDENCAGTASTFTWQGALNQAQLANQGSGTLGYTDWRLPNINELSSLIEKACHSPAINESVFPNTSYIREYVSASILFSDDPNIREILSVEFQYGRSGRRNYKNLPLMARLVRGGQ